MIMCWHRSPTAAGLELESSAPPMDLERPQGSSLPPLALPQGSSYPTTNSASPLSLAQLAQSPDLSMDLAAYNLSTASAMDSEEVGKSVTSPNVESAVTGQQEDGAEASNNESSNDESSAKAMSAETESAVAAESALKSGSAGDTPESVDSPAVVDKPVPQRTADKPETVVSPLEKPTQAVSGDASGPKAAMSTQQFDRAGYAQGDREVLGDDGGGERQVLGGDGRGEGHLKGEGSSGVQGSKSEEAVALTEEDLDSAMQELAQEVEYVPLFNSVFNCTVTIPTASSQNTVWPDTCRKCQSQGCLHCLTLRRSSQQKATQLLPNTASSFGPPGSSNASQRHATTSGFGHDCMHPRVSVSAIKFPALCWGCSSADCTTHVFGCYCMYIYQCVCIYIYLCIYVFGY